MGQQLPGHSHQPLLFSLGLRRMLQALIKPRGLTDQQTSCRTRGQAWIQHQRWTAGSELPLTPRPQQRHGDGRTAELRSLQLQHTSPAETQLPRRCQPQLLQH